MTTEKQLLANRSNALKGGVKTVEGKAVVRLNAVSHGIFSRQVLVQGEDGGLLAALRDKLTDELKPQGELETVLVERIITGIWRLRRVLRSEKKLSSSSLDYRYKSWQNFIQYETTIERQVYKAMHELERLQRARMGEYNPAPLAIDLDIDTCKAGQSP